MKSIILAFLCMYAASSFTLKPNCDRFGLVHSDAELKVAKFAKPSRSRLSMIRGGAGSLPKSLLTQVARLIFSIPLFLFRSYQSMTAQQKLTAVGCLVTGFALGRIKPFWIRYTSVMDIPKSYYNRKVLTGRAITVSDGDTFRFLHTPTPWSPKELQKGEKASEQALPIRLCTIDTPETAKFGKPGQPFGKEAKAHLNEMLSGKPVKIRLLQSDQYGRGVAEVFTANLFGQRKYMDQAMLEDGLAEVYTGGGAVYGPLGKDAYLDLQEQAESSKTGMWSQGSKRESAAEYKRRTKS